MPRWRVTICAVVIVGCGEYGRGIAPIRLEPVVTLGASSGDGAIATTPTVSALHPGGFRIVVPAHSAIGASPLVYDDRGGYRESLRGDGTPDGSLDGAMYTRFGPGDSIWLFDNSGRVLLYSPRLKYLRSLTLAAAPADAIVLGDDRIVAMTPEATVQLLDTTGAIVRVIALAPSNGAERQLLIPGSNGTFWTSTVAGSWQLQHWDTGGTRLGGVVLQPEWLTATAASIGATAPVPTIVAVWFDGGGRLWVVGQVADRNWREGTATSAGEQVVSDDDKYYDSVVEVRDGTTGAVMATTRFDKRILSSAGPGVLVHVARTSAGWQRAELLRVVWDGSTSRP